MTKSKKFWAAMAVLSLAAMVYSGWSVYGRVMQHFSGDTIEVRPVPMPPPSEDNDGPAAAETKEQQAAQEDRADRDEDAKAGKPQAAAAKPAARAEAAKPAPRAEGEKQKAVRTTFEYKDAAAKSVSISGSFTSWKAKRMAKKNGVWRTDVYILPGTYPYHFEVDGKKKTDPGKPKSPLGDSLVTVN